ncbi:hypothetical protein A7D16_05790 [Xanthomonas nasturtii]|uniref:hypothetical protein n=1 Tax=Xanthomonas nasturtii TaxID=1843581 RepID=UPI0007E48FA5|nr:hypothetical protein [Xanthomonas nasturtii]OAX85790.1 hypothetical protein A7D16_05790 [Xanthomonas nasturtii]WVL58473.1 hypothetical protein M3O54_009830 [Xanthomonas nasturtii]
MDDAMKMTPELAHDLVRLQPLMDKANEPESDAQIVAAAFAASQVVVRDHNQEFAEYFARRLSGVALTFNRGEFNYSFKDTADAAHAFTMLSMQQVNDAKSKAISVAVVNLLLKDMQYRSSFDSDEAYLTAILMVAHSMYAFRRVTFNQFVAEGRRSQGATFWRYFVIGAVVVGIAHIVLS